MRGIWNPLVATLASAAIVAAIGAFMRTHTNEARITALEQSISRIEGTAEADHERLVRVETKVDGVAYDVKAIRDVVKEVVIRPEVN
jgi:pyruvate/2-oxoglutarate dehydrogenase complex dihydrolipoamide acyltransferase (E2) component